jgi:hypothetical protein
VRRSFAPAYLEHAHGIFEAFEGVFAAIVEEEAFAGDELADDVGDEDFAAVCLGGDAGGDDDGGAEEVAAPVGVVFGDWFAGVEAAADLYAVIGA